MPNKSLPEAGKSTRFTKENAAEMGRRSAAARAQKGRRTRAMKEVLDALLQLPVKDVSKVPLTDLQSFSDANGANLTVEQLILIMQIKSALMGSTKAAIFLRDTAGQKILRDAADNSPSYEDDGFTKALKTSAKNIWGDKDAKKTKAANKAGC